LDRNARDKYPSLLEQNGIDEGKKVFIKLGTGALRPEEGGPPLHPDLPGVNLKNLSSGRIS
jgi:hypothetical protein